MKAYPIFRSNTTLAKLCKMMGCRASWWMMRVRLVWLWMATETRMVILKRRKNTIYSNLTTLQHLSKQALEESSSDYQTDFLRWIPQKLNLKKEVLSFIRKCITAVKLILRWSSIKARRLRPSIKLGLHRSSIKLVLHWNSSTMLRPKVPSWSPNCHTDRRLL